MSVHAVYGARWNQQLIVAVASTDSQARVRTGSARFRRAALALEQPTSAGSAAAEPAEWRRRPAEAGRYV